MTIQVNVTNQDSRETAVVLVETYHDGSETPSSRSQLKGGESKDVSVYTGMQLVVREVQVLGRQASHPELSLTWYDAAKIAARARQREKSRQRSIQERRRTRRKRHARNYHQT